MTYNLDSLKKELLDYLVAEGFTVFRSRPGAMEGLPTVSWDTDAHPEYEPYLNVAKAAGARIVLFADREFQSEEIDDALEQCQDSDLGPGELRPIERGLADLRAFVGHTCTIEMAFDHEGRLYVYELMTDWFQTYVDLSDLLFAVSSPVGPDEDEDESDSSFGGYYSKN